ncbi:MAG: hypothetical protein M3Z00_12630 [Actinomycetota bacterium]|nr:hypothetical protein [Actinomycetota bacterium]
MAASLFLTVPLGVVLLLPAAAALTAGLRGRAGTLRRASTLGIHGPTAQSSEEAFALANRVAAPVATAAAGVFALGAVLVIALRLPVLATLVIFAVALIGSVALLVAAGILGERAAATVPKPAARPATCDGCVCGSGGCAGLTKAGLANQD